MRKRPGSWPLAGPPCTSDVHVPAGTPFSVARHIDLPLRLEQIEIQVTTDIKLFDIERQPTTEIPGRAATVERSLHQLIEQNLEEMLGIRLLGSEYSTGEKQRGRIDTLGIDENSSPVIIEYKRTTNENVINQGLFYLDWLFDHRAEFELLVLRKLGKAAADEIDWSAPRLLCIAGGFTRYDEHAIEQMNRNIELIRYRRFGTGLLMLEMVNASSAEPGPAPIRTAGVGKTMSETLDELDGPLLDLYQALRGYLKGLGDDIQVKTLQNYVAFKRLRNFARVKVFAKSLRVYLKVDPATVALEPGFTEDVRGKGRAASLAVTLSTLEHLERAKPLLQDSYDVS